MKEGIPATIQKVETMSRYARIQVDTQEGLTSEQLGELFELHEKVGWFFFLEKQNVKITSEMLPEIHLDEGEKSPSQRQRAVLYIWWQQKTDQKQDFELFYRRWMERSINAIKEQLT